MEIGIKFESIWSDIDVVEVRIAAWNGEFGGSADVYVEIGGILMAAAKLEGFPHNTADVCDLEFGSFGLKTAGGAVTLRFHSRGAVGRTFVETTIESAHDEFDHAQRAILFAPVEAAAIDSFVANLRILEERLHSVAFLRLEGSAS